jgi:SAM-dependent methyltransferase
MTMLPNASVAAHPMSTARLSAASLPPDYIAMLSRDRHDNVPAFLHHAAELIGNDGVRGKRVLEIGSGRGLMAILMALQRAQTVVSLEPELVGARSGVIDLQRERARTLRLQNLDVVAADFNAWEHGGPGFDVILSRASINHLYESANHALHDPATYEQYLRIARKIHGLLNEGGTFVAIDASRYAFFRCLRRFGIRRPWRWEKTGVDWRYHQTPGTWARLFREAGYSRVDIAYPVPYPLRHLSAIAGTAAANFFLKGSFILRATR